MTGDAGESEGVTINADDFASADIKGSFVNQTFQGGLGASESFHDGKFGGNEDSDPNRIEASVDEMTDGGVTLGVPERSCTAGHQLTVNIELINKGETTRFVCQGKVVDQNPPVDGRKQVIVNFTRYEEADWARIQDFYKGKQKDLLELFHNLRGY